MVQRICAAAAIAAMFALAACGGGSSSVSPPAGSGSTTAPSPTSAATPASMPQTATIAGSTAFTSSANGHTLYFFGADTSGVSNCNASNGCSGVWPAYSAPSGTGAPSGSGFSIITRGDGTQQWAYNGSPLYEYSGDSAAGQDNGQGITSFGGTWTTARPASSTPSPAPTSTSTPYATQR